jgi:ABC-type sugar transport system permease subunit
MTEFGGTRFEYGYASAMSVFLMAAMLIIYRLFTKVLKTFGAE